MTDTTFQFGSAAQTGKLQQVPADSSLNGKRSGDHGCGDPNPNQGNVVGLVMSQNKTVFCSSSVWIGNPDFPAILVGFDNVPRSKAQPLKTIRNGTVPIHQDNHACSISTIGVNLDNRLMTC